MPTNSVSNSNAEETPRSAPRAWSGHAKWLDEVLAQDGPRWAEESLGQQAQQRLNQGSIDEDEARFGKWELTVDAYLYHVQKAEALLAA